MIMELLKKLVVKENLSKDEITRALCEILDGSATHAQSAAFLMALRMKGETIEEITAAVELLKEKSAKLNLKDKNVIDIVGTGGDGANTFNISTAAAFVVASGGVRVAKHGNVAASSKSGSADILQALGANIFLNVEQNEEILEKTGFCFMLAPKFIPQMKNVAPIRKEIGVRTIFNCLGPLVNPSGAKFQLIGVYDKNLVSPVAHVMKNLGIEGGTVLFGECGLDEASVVSKTYLAKIENGKITEEAFSPEDFNIKRAEIAELKGGEPKENARIMKGIFENKIKGAKQDVVALNAALAFLTVKKVTSVQEGLKLAYSLIESGAAKETLTKFIEETNGYSK